MAQHKDELYPREKSECKPVAPRMSLSALSELAAEGKHELASIPGLQFGVRCLGCRQEDRAGVGETWSMVVFAVSWMVDAPCSPIA